VYVLQVSFECLYCRSLFMSLLSDKYLSTMSKVSKMSGMSEMSEMSNMSEMSKMSS